MPKRTDISKVFIFQLTRLILVSAYCLLIPGEASGECVTVSAQPYQPSSQNIRIIALLDGKPLKHTKIEVRPNNVGASTGVFFTNRRGVAFLRALVPGDYSIFATANNNRSAYLYLNVAAEGARTVSSFPMSLAVPPPPAVEEHRYSQTELQTAEKIPVKVNIQDFRGVVRDESGAVVPLADIQVFRKSDQTLVAKLQSNHDGRFSEHLAGGEYIAFFRSQGFRTEVLVFGVLGTGANKDIEISLQLGSC